MCAAVEVILLYGRISDGVRDSTVLSIRVRHPISSRYDSAHDFPYGTQVYISVANIALSDLGVLRSDRRGRDD